MRYSNKDKNRSLPLFIDSMGTNWYQEPVYRPEGYRYVHWLQSQKGTGQVEVDGKIIELKEGSGILINTHIPHAYFAKKKGWITGYFAFGGSLCSEIMSLLGFSDYFYVDKLTDEMEDFIAHLFSDIHSTAYFFSFDLSGRIYTFLIMLKKYQMQTSDATSRKAAIVQPVIDFIQKNYASSIKQEDLSACINYSPQYTNRIFKDVYGMSPYQYLMDTRLVKAKELLTVCPELSITDVCLAVGFNDTSYFISLFKKKEQITPSTFRKQSLARKKTL